MSADDNERSSRSIREKAIDRLLDELIRRRHDGERLSDEQVMSEHAELMPELGVRLEELARVQRAGAAGDETRSSNATGDATQPLRRPPKGPIGELHEPASKQAQYPRIKDYQIIGDLGGGGQGRVFKAIYRGHITRAVKVFREFSDEESVRHTAKVLNNLHGEAHIVAIQDIGRTEEGKLYLGSDFIDGKTLDAFLDDDLKDPSLPPAAALSLFHKITEVVSFAHTRGVIHGDLKPANIMVGENGEPHLLDFDLARTGASFAVDGHFIGSLPWAAPEQAARQQSKVDTRTDVYSLGVILYFMATGGRFPYAHLDNIAEMLHEISRAAVIPPSARMGQARHRLEARQLRPPQVPINTDIEWVVLKALSRRRDDRFRTAGELGDVVKKYLRGEEVRPPEAAGPASASKPPIARVPQTDVMDPLKQPKFSMSMLFGRWKLTLAVVALVLLATAIPLAMFMGKGPPNQVAIAPSTQPSRISSLRQDTPPVDTVPGGSSVDASRPGPPVGAVPTGPPLTKMALVTNPMRIAGIDSWTIETRGYRGDARAVAVSRGGLIAVGSDDGAIRIWQKDEYPLKVEPTIPLTAAPTILLGHEAPVDWLAWSANGAAILSHAADGTLRVWDFLGGREIHKFSLAGAGIPKAAISPDGTLVAIAQHGLADVYKADGVKINKTPLSALAIDWKPSEAQVLGLLKADGGISLWDPAVNSDSQATVANSNDDGCCLAFSPMGERYMCAIRRPEGAGWLVQHHGIAGIQSNGLPPNVRAEQICWSIDNQFVLTRTNVGVFGWSLTDANAFSIWGKDSWTWVPRGIAWLSKTEYALVGPRDVFWLNIHASGQVLAGPASGQPPHSTKSEGNGVTRPKNTPLLLSGHSVIQITPEGFYSPATKLDDYIVFVEQAGGEQRTLSPKDFASHHNWENKPERVLGTGR